MLVKVLLMKQIKFHDIGLRDYKETWDLQEQLFQQVLQQKERNDADLIHHLIFCEHPHVYTLGKSGDEQNLLLNLFNYKQRMHSLYILTGEAILLIMDQDNW